MAKATSAHGANRACLPRAGLPGALWVSLFGRDRVEGQPRSLSVPARFVKGADT